MSPTPVHDQASKTTSGESSKTSPKTMAAPYHPLDQLTPLEITLSSQTVRKYVAEKTDIKAFKFIFASLKEPSKLDVLKHLGIPLSHEDKPQPPANSKLERLVDISLIDEVTGRAYEAVVRLDSATSGEVTSWIQLPEGVQPSLTVEELCAAEELCRESPVIRQLCEDVGVKPEQIFCDGWSIGIDSRFPHSKRLQQCVMYARTSEHDNLYAHPMDIFPVFDCNTAELLTIDYAPTRDENGVLSTGTTIPPNVVPADQAKVDDLAQRSRIPPPLESFGEFISIFCHASFPMSWNTD